MNKRVITTMIILGWAYLALMVFIKILFADKLLIEISNSKLILIGNYIDNHVWLEEIVYFLTTFLTYWLYLCAVCRKWTLSILWTTALVCIVVILQVIKTLSPTYGTYLDIIVMIVLPYVMKAEYKMVVVIFTMHILGQLALLFVRSMSPSLNGADFITSIVMTVDMYIWLFMYYLYSNKYKGDFSMGKVAPPLFGNSTKWMQKKVQRIDRKINKLTLRKDAIMQTLDERKDQA